MNRQHINSLIGVLLGARLEQLSLITYTYYMTITIIGECNFKQFQSARRTHT